MNHVIDLCVEAVQLAEVMHDCDVAVDIDSTVVVAVTVALVIKYDHAVLL